MNIIRGISDTAIRSPQPDWSPETPSLLKSRSAGTLTHKVFGWHPYWAASELHISVI
ncbi:MAG: hypothetical protein MZV63_20950 [Marinilabiliales bacterium]|nr:hypothetical protein [Marinilabiliales bacterium]